MSFETVRAKKNILSKCFCSVIVHGIYYFSTFVHLCWHDAIDEWYRFVDTIRNVWKIKWQQKSNLMILDNSGIDYAEILLFVFGFLVYCNIEPNSRYFSCLRQHLVYDMLTKRSRQSSQKNKMWYQRKQFLKFYYNK